MTIKDGIITEKYGDTDGDKTKTVTKKQSFAITAADTLGADQSGALSWNVLSVIDSDGKSHIMTLSTVNPAANGEGNDTISPVPSFTTRGAIPTAVPAKTSRFPPSMTRISNHPSMEKPKSSAPRL